MQMIEGTKKRITSTHVENTLRGETNIADDGDHLHTRGEYRLVVMMIRFCLGSPPHTWRIPSHKSHVRDSHRITSTHVENTVNKSQYNNNHKTIDPKISSLCQLLLYLFMSH